LIRPDPRDTGLVLSRVKGGAFVCPGRGPLPGGNLQPHFRVDQRHQRNRRGAGAWLGKTLYDRTGSYDLAFRGPCWLW